jgi:hypothetical protein
VRVEKAMKKGATVEDYEEALEILYPGDDKGLAHHKFWDAQSINRITEMSGQTPHKGLKFGIDKMREGYRFPLTPGLAGDMARGSDLDDVTVKPGKFIPLGEGQRSRLKYQQEYLSERADQDILGARNFARAAFMRHVPNGANFGSTTGWWTTSKV